MFLYINNNLLENKREENITSIKAIKNRKKQEIGRTLQEDIIITLPKDTQQMKSYALFLSWKNLI